MRPEPLQTSTTHKFPLNVRQYYVNAMQDISVQIYTSSEDAAQRAVREEFACYERCKAINVYKNSCMLTVHRLRKEVDQKSSEESSLSAGSAGTGMMSHEAVLAGKVKGSWSVIKPKRSVTDFKGVSLYNVLTKWILSEQELKDNGFPRLHPDGPKVWIRRSRCFWVEGFLALRWFAERVRVKFCWPGSSEGVRDEHAGPVDAVESAERALLLSLQQVVHGRQARLSAEEGELHLPLCKEVHLPRREQVHVLQAGRLVGRLLRRDDTRLGLRRH